MAPLPTWPLAEIALNSEPVKYAILALTSPLWIPFFKALWHTLNDGLREEGGLLGRPPTEEQLRELEHKHGPAAATLISVPKEGPVAAVRGGRPIIDDKAHARGRGAGTRAPERARGSAPRGPARPPRSGGFR